MPFWDEIHVHCTMNKENSVDFVSFVFDTTVFSYDGVVYKQKEGTPMGSIVSPIIAQFVEGLVLDRTLPSFTSQVPFYKKFVDDIVTAVPEDQIQASLDILRSHCQCREYTLNSKYLLPKSDFGDRPLPLIIDGEKAGEGEFPHMAVIAYQKSGSPELHWACGGSLISSLFVVTAAHCSFSPEYGIPIKIRIGTTFMKSEKHSQERKIVEILKHPHREGFYHDIALLRLEYMIDFNIYVRPACLSIQDLGAITATATGFGVTDFSSTTMNQYLMKTTLTIYPYDNCMKIYEGLIEDELPKGLLPSQLCAGDPKGRSDTCSGDSGGPLQIRKEEPFLMYEIIGVTSFGLFCGQPNMPSFFTKISHYTPWIEQIVWDKKFRFEGGTELALLTTHFTIEEILYLARKLLSYVKIVLGS
ncbi:hypothetical protein WA026_016604 [Henosepilachna vigintioctopunctata]|uniref:Uncharacterized protein n=1 Tax=Henosepilachna vigintioctopunctata TaxID=420089 RepID=A0AAW1VHQ2_9CUCU